MHTVFGGAPISLKMWLDVVVVSLAAFITVELEKWIRHKMKPRGAGSK
jgi:hypothetical protein